MNEVAIIGWKEIARVFNCTEHTMQNLKKNVIIQMTPGDTR